MNRFSVVFVAFCCFFSIVNSVKSENCKYITKIPVTILVQGVYCFDRHWPVNLSSGTAITIATGHVTIDMKNYKLGNLAAGPTNKATGIRAIDQINVTVRNGVVRGFLFGIRIWADGALIEDNVLDFSYYSGIHAEGNNIVVRNNYARNTGGGIGQRSAHGIGMPDSANVQVYNNTISNTFAKLSARGIFLSDVQIAEVWGNAVYDLNTARYTYGIDIHGQSENIILTNNSFINKGLTGTTAIRALTSTGIYCTENTIIGFVTPTSGCDYLSANHAR